MGHWHDIAGLIVPVFGEDRIQLATTFAVGELPVESFFVFQSDKKNWMFTNGHFQATLLPYASAGVILPAK